MHNYFRAIGFGKGYQKFLIRNIVKKAIDEYVSNNDVDQFGKIIEIFVQFNQSMGLAIHGEFVGEKQFEAEYVFPYIKAKRFANYDGILIERNVSQYSFSAGYENGVTGITIIFYLQNDLDYVNNGFPEKVSAQVGLAALSLEGKIIFPTCEYDEYRMAYRRKLENRSKMIEEAQNGDETAMENLTLEEMNEYTKLSKRIKKEDVLSIVDTSFMPYGMQCDRYSVIGKILETEKCVNRVTGEIVYNMTMECNNVIMNVGINEIDLLGEPKPGRRFKGNIWLQGMVKF